MNLMTLCDSHCPLQFYHLRPKSIFYLLTCPCMVAQLHRIIEPGCRL